MTLLDLRDALHGSLITPDDSGWDAARLFHSGIGEPDAIVHPSDVDDVVAAVRYAADNHLPIAVRGGGHSAWGSVPGGLTIDLGGLAAVEAEGTLVRIGGGATWGEVARTLAPLGLGLSSGDTASVGVGGLTLGGGIGWMVRAWGLAADQLVGAQVVTASGEVVETSAEEHPDLFWALRGGSGNFGVVTRFDFRAHELRGVAVADLAVSGDRAAVLRALRDTMLDAPRELTVTFMDVPPMDPSAPAGATVTAVWAGPDPDALRAALGSFLDLDGITVTALGVKPYPDILLDMPGYDPDQPMPGFIGGNTLLVDPDDAALGALADYRASSDASMLFLRSLGGAYADVPQHDTPFPARDATWFAMSVVFDIPGLVDDAARAGFLATWAAIEARGAAVYGNFTQDVDGSVVAKMYTPDAATRLAGVKRAWDPENLFSRTHNVLPG